MSTLLIGMAIIMTVNAGVMAALEVANRAPSILPHHFKPFRPTGATLAQKLALFTCNSTMAVAAIVGSGWLAFDHLYTTTSIGLGHGALQALALILVYDFIYYALHRWVFHNKKLMKYVHALHHRATTPTAWEGLYTHPVEMFAGLFVWLLSVWLVGPVNVYAFLPAFAIYTVTNIIIHSGIRFSKLPLSLLNPIAEHHFRHHGVKANSNYASITPIWDWLFKTTA
jgi:sterol desaturase/sphingolipid hydroxylase (fatty acid hydroxylase superfamily)